MGITAIRYSDLMPEIPIADDSNVMEVYADCIGALKTHGANFTITYCAYGRPIGSSVLQRIPVLKVVRPLTSVRDIHLLLEKSGEVIEFPRDRKH